MTLEPGSFVIVVGRFGVSEQEAEVVGELIGLPFPWREMGGYQWRMRRGLAKQFGGKRDWTFAELLRIGQDELNTLANVGNVTVAAMGHVMHKYGFGVQWSKGESSCATP